MGITGFTNSPNTFGICRFIMGLGVGGTFPNTIALASEYSPARNRTLMGGGIAGGMLVGGIAAALFAMWLFPHHGWRSVFFVGAIPLILMPVYGKLLPESPDHLLKRGRLEELRALLRKARPTDSLPKDAALEVTKGSGKVPLAAVFQGGRAFSSVVIWIMFFMNMFVIFGFTVWLPKLMMNAGYSLGSGLFFLLTLQVVSLVGGQVFPMVADRIGARPALVIAFLLAFTCIVPGAVHAQLCLALGPSWHVWIRLQRRARGSERLRWKLLSAGDAFHGNWIDLCCWPFGRHCGARVDGHSVVAASQLSDQHAHPGGARYWSRNLHTPGRDKYNFGRQQQESRQREAAVRHA